MADASAATVPVEGLSPFRIEIANSVAIGASRDQWRRMADYTSRNGPPAEGRTDDN